MKQIVKRFAAQPALRYVALIAIVLLTAVGSWGVSLAIDEAAYFKPAVAPVMAYLLATPIWIVLAILERRGLFWRLLLIWAPEALPIALLINVLVQGDSTGLGGLIGLLLVGAFGLASTVGSVVALFYRPPTRIAASR